MLSSTTNTLEFSPVMQSPLHPFGLAAKQEKINNSRQGRLFGAMAFQGHAYH